MIHFAGIIRPSLNICISNKKTTTKPKNYQIFISQIRNRPFYCNFECFLWKHKNGDSLRWCSFLPLMFLRKQFRGRWTWLCVRFGLLVLVCFCLSACVCLSVVSICLPICFCLSHCFCLFVASVCCNLFLFAYFCLSVCVYQFLFSLF